MRRLFLLFLHGINRFSHNSPGPFRFTLLLAPELELLPLDSRIDDGQIPLRTSTLRVRHLEAREPRSSCSVVRIPELNVGDLVVVVDKSWNRGAQCDRIKSMQSKWSTRYEHTVLS